jgi:hypothetical protein
LVYDAYSTVPTEAAGAVTVRRRVEGATMATSAEYEVGAPYGPHDTDVEVKFITYSPVVNPFCTLMPRHRPITAAGVSSEHAPLHDDWLYALLVTTHWKVVTSHS